MANTYGTNAGKVINGTGTPEVGQVNGTVRCFTEVVTLASQADGDTITVARLPKGATPLYGIVNNSATLGSSTIAIGISGTAGKYRASATKTSTTPEVFGLTAALGGKLSADEDIIITNTTAALPSSGTLVVMFFYAMN
jgi:hypothetical protein